MFIAGHSPWPFSKGRLSQASLNSDASMSNSQRLKFHLTLASSLCCSTPCRRHFRLHRNVLVFLMTAVALRCCDQWRCNGTIRQMAHTPDCFMCCSRRTANRILDHGFVRRTGFTDSTMTLPPNSSMSRATRSSSAMAVYACVYRPTRLSNAIEAGDFVAGPNVI